MAEKALAVDMEQCRPKQFQHIAEYAFTETEQKWLTQSTDIQRDFFLLWTIKEADIKQHGGSIFSIRNAVRIHPPEGTAVSHAGESNTVHCTASADNAALTAYPHTIVSFYITALSLQATNRTLSLYGATQQRRIPALLPNGFLPILPKEHNNRRKRKGAHNTDKKRQGKRTYRNKATERQRPER